MRVVLTKGNVTVSREESEATKMIAEGWTKVEPKVVKKTTRKKKVVEKEVVEE